MKEMALTMFIDVGINKTPGCAPQGDQNMPCVDNSRVGKTLSEVGFEPTPTFVDQNTPVRKSSTLESGALDRSAILTCRIEKIIKYLIAKDCDLRGNPVINIVDLPRFYLSQNN